MRRTRISKIANTQVTTAVDATDYVRMRRAIKSCLRLCFSDRRETTNINLKMAPDKSLFSIQRHAYIYLSDVYGNQRRCETLIMEAISHCYYICRLKAHKTVAHKRPDSKNMPFSLFLRFVSLLFLHFSL